ncbi:MAG TPA: ribonuclease Z [Actinoplanes sp.]|jgi:ribonuclease Z|nr:ribonuclease Z [Actinoplanes sp.]
MRELTILGTASQVPTRYRNHNGYLLRWDGEAILFDPGEGTQRQMLMAGLAVSPLTRICITHFHGDHSLGLPGVIQRISLDKVPHPVVVNFPAGGREYFDRLRYATSFWDNADLHPEPVSARLGGRPWKAETSAGHLTALPLWHSLETYGYRLVEPDGRRMLPERLAAHGIAGPAVGELQRTGRLGAVTLADVSVPRPGQRFAFVMDTGLCDNVFALAEGVDLLVIESTFLAEDADTAAMVGHLTAGQAATVARECRVRTLVLTHFSQRYPDASRFLTEAREQFDGEIVIAEDLMRVPVPARIASGDDRPPAYRK